MDNTQDMLQDANQKSIKSNLPYLSNISSKNIKRLLNNIPYIYKILILTLFLLLFIEVVINIMYRPNTINEISMNNAKTATPSITQNHDFKYNELADINDSEFTVPNPPTNHRSIVSLLHDGMPFTKYISSPSGIPNDWIDYRNAALSFKYPSELSILDIGYQRLAFYKTPQEVVQAKECLETYGSIFSDTCNLPVFVIYYSAYNDLEYENKGSYGWAALYGLDNREWRAEISGKPSLVNDLSFETATDKSIVSIKFISDFNDHEKSGIYILDGMERNLRDQAYSMVSSVEFIDDSLLKNYISLNREIETNIVKINTNDLDPMSIDATYGDLPRLLDRAFGIDYVPDTSDKEADYSIAQERGKAEIGASPIKINPDTFYVNRYKNMVKSGVYKYKELTINVLGKDNSLVLYVSDPRYCVNTNDCFIRDNFCHTGAFNKYHPFYSVYGCTRADFDGLTEDENTKYHDQCSDNSYWTYENDGVSCINNTCTTLNPRLVCQAR
jgi:hypothetical protein